MKTLDRNWKEYLGQVDLFIELADINKEKSRLISKEMKRFITVKFEKKKWIHPISTGFSTHIYRELYRLINKKDPYKKLKEKSNEEAVKIIKKIKPKSFSEIVLCTILGNIIDYGACLEGVYNIGRLKNDFEKIKKERLSIDDTEVLKKKIEKAKNVLYLVDNSGEIIFDSFMFAYILRYVPKENLFIGAKEKPMLNDMTAKELKELGFEKYGTIISTGSDCFGLHEEEVSKKFKKILKNADLIIAKGQAYMEFFGEYNFRNVFNILRVKYPIVWNNFRLELGQNVVMSSERYADNGKKYGW